MTKTSLLKKLRNNQLYESDNEDALFVFEKMEAQIVRLKSSLKLKNQILSSRLKVQS